MKSKKIISFVCSLAMTVSAFTGVFSAQAADDEITQGIVLTYNEEASTSTSAVIDIKAVGIGSVSSWQANITVPSDVTYTATFDNKVSSIQVGDAVRTDTSTYNVGGFTGAAVATTNGELDLCTVTLTFDAVLTTDFTAELATGSLLGGKSESGETVTLKLAKGTLAASPVTVLAAPNATEPPATDAPTPEPITQGIVLTYDKAASSSTKAVVDIKAVGVGSVSSWQTNIAIPSNVAYTATFENKVSSIQVGDAVRTDTSTYNVGGFTGAAVAATNGELDLCTVTFTFDPALTEDFTAELATGSLLGGTSESGEAITLKLAKGTLPASPITILANPAVETEAPTATATSPVETEAPTATVTEAPYETVRPARRISTPEPVATEEAPTETITETPTEPITQGIVLTYDKAASSSTKAVVDIKAVGVGSVSSWQTNIAIPSNVAYTATFENKVSSIQVGDAVRTDTSTYNVGGFTGAAVATTNGELDLCTVTFTFDPALTEDFASELATGSLLGGTSESGETVTLKLAKGTLPASPITILANPVTAVETEAPSTTETVATEAPANFTGDETVKFSDLANTTGLENLIGFEVSATGTYGKDYAAFLNGTQLTEDEFLDAVHGYTATPEELIAGMTIVANDGVTITVTPATQTAEQAAKVPETWTLYPGLAVTKTITKATETPTQTVAPTATAKPSNSGNSGNSGSSGGGKTSSGTSSTIASSVGSTVNGGITTSGVNFQDLSSVPWAVTAINALVTMGVINGRSNTEFDPNATVTRAEFTKMVCAAFGVVPSTKTTQTFTDVLTSDWYFGYVEAAAEKGIVLGISDTEFAPNAPITREQMAAMMYRAINATSAVLKQGASKTFTDEYAISDYAKASVDALSAAGVINGVSDTEFAPQADATRAQAACIIYQYFTSLAG